MMEFGRASQSHLLTKKSNLISIILKALSNNIRLLYFILFGASPYPPFPHFWAGNLKCMSG